MEWIREVFNSTEFGLAILPASALLGLATAFGSGCNLAMLAAIAGYAGSRDNSFTRRDAVYTSIFFLVGTTISLAALGLLVGYFGKIAGGSLGRYGMALVGLIAIFFGLFSLGLMPVRLPSIDLSKKKLRGGFIGAGLFGLAIGAASLTCSLGCSGPLLPFVLSVAAARGQTGWGAVILAAFAIGYSLPLAAIMLGIGVGRMTSFFKKAAGPIRIVFGTALLVVGFWILATL
jgi:cytochrome c-type biogenesis protein